MYDSILLPVAPGSTANDAIPHATSLATQYGSTVYVVSAIDSVTRTLRGAQAGSVAKRVETAAETRVEDVTAALSDAGIDTVGNVIRGDPLSVIENTITDVDADLVVMPSHTRTGLQRMLLGSVTEKVIRVSPVPVVTVPIPDGDEHEPSTDDASTLWTDTADEPATEETDDTA